VQILCKNSTCAKTVQIQFRLEICANFVQTFSGLFYIKFQHCKGRLLSQQPPNSTAPFLDPFAETAEYGFTVRAPACIQRADGLHQSRFQFIQCGVVSGQVRSGIIQRHGAFRKKSFRLPIIQSEHRTHLPLREASGAITFNRRAFHDATAYRVRGFSPPTGNLIGYFNYDFHNAGNLARQRWHWQLACLWRD
jgi:hypothetical protein